MIPNEISRVLASTLKIKGDTMSIITDGTLTEQNGTGRCKPCLRFTHHSPKSSTITLEGFGTFMATMRF